jgi:hypothetical protein
VIIRLFSGNVVSAGLDINEIFGEEGQRLGGAGGGVVASSY